MTTQQYVDDILLQLGNPVLEIEIKDSISKIVDMAFREVKHYITDTKTITLTYSNKIHIDKEKVNINSVVYIMRSSSPNRISDFQDIMYLNSRRGMMQYVSLTDYNRALLTNQVKNTISTDLYFYWDKDNSDLYVNANYPKPDTISVVYIPEYTSVEDVKESFWENLIKRMALALTKEVLGRIRGKYTLSTATYQLDASQLLAESQQELQEIRTYLNDNSDMLLPID